MPFAKRTKRNKMLQNLKRTFKFKKLTAQEQREKNELEERLLIDAAASGDLREMKKLIRKGVDVECDDKDGNTPLHVAILHGHRDSAKILMRAGAGIEIINSQHETPFHIAVDQENEETVMDLLDARADLDARDREKNTPLHIACIKGYESVIRTLLEKGADCEASGAGGNTPLHLGSKFGGLPVAKALLAVGVNVDALNDSLDTPLHLAAGSESSDIVRALLETGAKWFVLNNEGNLPLHLACRQGNGEAVKLLILKSQPELLNTQNKQGYTPLHFAARNQQIEIAKELIAAGAGIDVKDEDGNAPYDVTPGWCKELKELLTSKSSVVTDARREQDMSDLTHYLPCQIPHGSQPSDKDAVDLDEGHDAVLCSSCYLDVASPESFGDDKTGDFPTNETSNECRELHLGKGLHQQDGRNVRGQYENSSEQVSYVCSACMSGKPDTPGNSSSQRFLEHLRPGVCVANYIIEDEGLTFKSEIFAAKSKTEGTSVWLMVCSTRTVFEKMIKIYELLKEAEYVSKLVEVIAECPGWPSLPPLLVIERGSDSLKSSLNENRLDSHTKDQILNQILSGFEEMHGNGVVHGTVNLNAIEYFPGSHRWKFSLLHLSEIVGQPIECCSPSALLPPEMSTALKEGSTIIAKPYLDWWWYGVVALAVLTGKDVCSDELLLGIHGTTNWNDDFAAGVQSIGTHCCRELIKSLLLSELKTRKHPRYVLDCMRSRENPAAIELLRQSVATLMHEVKQIKQATIMTAGQVQCSNLDITLSLRHATSTSSLSQGSNEGETLILQDDSLPLCPIYALEKGGCYIIDISLVQKHGLKPPFEEISGIDVQQSDGTLLRLRTEKVACNYTEYKVRAFLDVSKLTAKQFHRPSPAFGSPEEKFPALELCFNCTIVEALALTVQARKTIHCCMFPKGSKYRLQRMMIAAQKTYLSVPQAARVIAKFGIGCVNTASALAGVAAF